MARGRDKGSKIGYSPQLMAGREGLPQLWGRQGFWQIRLRWAVAPVMIVGMLIGLALGFEFPIVPILAVALASPIYNALFAILFRLYRRRLETEPRLDRLFITAEVVADYAAMFLLLYFTGGVSSPLAIFLLFHVVIAAIQFSPATAYALAGVAAGGLWLLLLGQLFGWIPCHHLSFRGVPIHYMDRPVYVFVMLLFLTATFFITAGIVSRISARLRRRVGDLAEATSELARSHTAIKALMRERTQFTLEVAHNLRAPLSAGLGIVDLLRHGDVGEPTDRQKQQLDRLDTRLRSLSLTIGELLAIARTRDRSREIEDVMIDLPTLAHRTEDTFRSAAKDKDLKLRFMVDETLPRVASGLGLLEQLMENLVSNAIKYTKPGGEVTVRFENDQPGWVRIKVADTGIGIPIAEQDRLFQEFFRASNASKMTRDGTGLGLVLVKQTVERHEGTLSLESAEGEGTEILIQLPVNRDAAASRPAKLPGAP